MSPVSAREPEIIYESARKAWLLVLGALAFVAMGWFLITVAVDDSEWRLHRVAGPIGVFAIVFGALGVVFLLRRAIHRRPVLTLSDDGFIDGSMLGGNAFVPWSEVTELRIQRWGSVRCITGRVTEPDRLRVSATRWLVQWPEPTGRSATFGSPTRRYRFPGSW